MDWLPRRIEVSNQNACACNNRKGRERLERLVKTRGAWLRDHVWNFAVVVCEDYARDEVEVFIDFLGSQTSAIKSIVTRGTATEMSCGNT